MAKGSKGQSSNKKTPQKPPSTLSDSDMDDDIDVFHKQRDIVPLDLDDDMAESEEDNDQHVFEIEDGSDDDDDEDDFEDDSQLTGLAAKIAKQRKSLKAKLGGAKDETQDDDEDEEKKGVAWGRGKNIYYDNDEGESSEDEEEAEVLRLQNEKTKLYSNADHGLEDEDSEEDEEPTFEEKQKKGKVSSKANVGHEDDTDTGVEVVMKDPSSLSKEEQMDIVYNSAPELVGLLSELNDAVDQLETKVDPILSKLKEEKNLNKPGIQYMELKKQLLLSYCQAIAFHLLLKSEGHSVLDHPVLARLVEIKNLLDKMKPLDENLSFEVEEFLKNHTTTTTTTMVDSPNEITPVESIPLINNHKSTIDSSETQKEPQVETKIVDGGKRKRENEQRGLQSVEMLKVRAALEEKLKQKGVFNLKTTKRTDGDNKNLKPINGKLEARGDFDDDTFNMEGNQTKSRLSQVVIKTKKPRVISGDDDLPVRDDIGERRRKHEMRVLAGAGIQSDDDLQNDETTLEADGVNASDEDGETETESETDLYKETQIKRDAKLAAKAQKYSRTAPLVGVPETTVEGKRHINYEMEKNRGLTRKRNKEIKNPRKKYKLKHKKKEVARKGQVREHRNPTGPYGGEGSGINTISRSIRFKG